MYFRQTGQHPVTMWVKVMTAYGQISNTVWPRNCVQVLLRLLIVISSKIIRAYSTLINTVKIFHLQGFIRDLGPRSKISAVSASQLQ